MQNVAVAACVIKGCSDTMDPFFDTVSISEIKISLDTDPEDFTSQIYNRKPHLTRYTERDSLYVFLHYSPSRHNIRHWLVC